MLAFTDGVWDTIFSNITDLTVLTLLEDCWTELDDDITIFYLELNWTFHIWWTLFYRT